MEKNITVNETVVKQIFSLYIYVFDYSFYIKDEQSTLISQSQRKHPKHSKPPNSKLSTFPSNTSLPITSYSKYYLANQRQYANILQPSSFDDKGESLQLLISQTEQALQKVYSQKFVKRMCCRIAFCFMRFTVMQKEVTRHYRKTLEWVKQGAQISQNLFLCLCELVNYNLEQCKTQINVSLIRKCFAEGYESFKSIIKKEFIKKQEPRRQLYEEVEGFIKEHSRNSSKDYINLLVNIYELNKPRKSEAYQFSPEIKELEYSKMAEAFLQTFICFFCLMNVMQRIDNIDEQRRIKLMEDRNKFIQKLENQCDQQEGQHKSRNLKSDCLMTYPQEVFHLLNHLLILDILAFEKPNNVIQYKKMKTVKCNNYKQYGVKLLSLKGYFETLFPKQPEKEITYCIGWNQQVKLVKSLTNSLLQLQRVGILHVDLKFDNKAQIGQDYYLIDFDHAFKLFFEGDDQKYSSFLHKYLDIQKTYFEEHPKFMSEENYKKYLKCIFEATYKKDSFGGYLLKQLRRQNLGELLYFPPPHNLTKAQTAQLRMRISRCHLVQLAHMLTPIYAVNSNDSYNNKFDHINRIAELLQEAKNPQVNMMTMSTFYERFLNNAYDVSFRQLQTVQSFLEGTLREICWNNGCENQPSFVLITSSSIVNRYCSVCAQLLQLQQRLHSSLILINQKEPLKYKQEVDLRKCLKNIPRLDQTPFNARLFMKDDSFFTMIVRNCLQIDIQFQTTLTKNQAERQIFDRLEFFIDSMLMHSQKWNLRQMVDFYNNFEFKSFEHQRKYIDEKYEIYPLKEQSKFEMKENWDRIKTLYYNDNLLEKVYDEIIKEMVKSISRIHQHIFSLVGSFINYLNKIMTNTITLSVSQIRGKLQDVGVQLFYLLKKHQPKDETTTAGCKRPDDTIRQIIRTQIDIYKSEAWETLYSFKEEVGEKIEQIEQEKKENQQKSIIQIIVQKSFKLLRPLRQLRSRHIKSFEYSTINEALFFDLFKFERLVVELTSHINSRLQFYPIRKFIEKPSTLEPMERIQIAESKLHGVGRQANDMKIGIIFLSKDMSEEYVRNAFVDNQNMPASFIHTIYFGKEQVQEQVWLEEEDSDSDWSVGSDSIEQYYNYNYNNVLCKTIDLALSCCVSTLRSLIISHQLLGQRANQQLSSLFSQAINLRYLNLKQLKQLIPTVFQPLNPDIQSIDIHNIQFLYHDIKTRKPIPFCGLYLSNKHKLKHLTIQQLTFNSRIPGNEYFPLQYLHSLEHLCLRWFTNSQRNDDYFTSLENTPQMDRIKHLTLKTHSISDNFMRIIVKMPSLEVLNMKAKYYGSPLSVWLLHLQNMQNLVTLKIKVQQPFILPGVETADHQVNEDSDESSQLSFKSQQKDCVKEDPFLKEYTNIHQYGKNFSDIDMKKATNIIFNKLKRLRFLRLELINGNFQSSVPDGMNKLEIYQGCLDEDDKESSMHRGVIIAERPYQ